MKGPLWGLLLSLQLCIQCVNSQSSTSKKTWIIAIGDDFGAHEYRDQKGYLKGFGPDFIDAVCQENKMDCRLVLAPYTDCWVSGKGEHPYGGDGLMSKWFDACSSWVPTVERVHVFSFTRPYMRTRKSYFFSDADKPPFDPSDLRGKKIGFLRGWASNEQCIARQSNIKNNVLDPGTQIIYKDRVDDVLQALKSGEIDAVFTAQTTWTSAHASELRRAKSREVSCFLHGTGLMARKDSDFIQTWNTAFSKFIGFGGRFQRFCNATNQRHASKGTGTDCLE